MIKQLIFNVLCHAQWRWMLIELDGCTCSRDNCSVSPPSQRELFVIYLSCHLVHVVLPSSQLSISAKCSVYFYLFHYRCIVCKDCIMWTSCLKVSALLLNLIINFYYELLYFFFHKRVSITGQLFDFDTGGSALISGLLDHVLIMHSQLINSLLLLTSTSFCIEWHFI